jgi:hypothetical protein
MEGIPDAYRGRVWYELLDWKPPDPGEKRPTVEDFCGKAVPAYDHVIKADVPRTMAYVNMFCGEDVQESLYLLLRAYSNADRELRYSQGMAFSAGLLRAYMSETRAFWAFWHLMKGSKHELSQFYVCEFSRLKELNQVWEVLLQKNFPKIARHLKKLQVDTMLYTSAWFLTGFQSIHFPKPLKLRLFDRQVAFGTRALLSFALTIVSIEKKQLETENAEILIPFLQNPMKFPKFPNWQNLIQKFDSHFLTTKEYNAAFKKACIEVFP